MRAMLAIFSLIAVSACVEVKPREGEGRVATAPGYTLEIRASEAEQFFVITAPDGERVGARAAEGVSALMDAAAIDTLAQAMPLAEPDEMQEQVSFRMPGLNLSVRGEPDGKDGGGQVSINVGGQSIQVDASEGGAAGDRANVRISGVSEAEAREFIAKTDVLSPAVQAQMLAELGLE